MTERSFLTCMAVLAVLVVVAGAPSLAAAQSDDHARTRWSGQLGLATFGTGDDANCATGVAIGVGGEVRTPGPWLAALGADAFGAVPQGCTLVGTSVRYDGQWVDVFGSNYLYGATRLRARVGRSIALGRLSVEPSVAVGGMYSRAEFLGDDDRWLWNGWLGGLLDVRGSGWGVRLEVGGHQVPTRYYDGREVVHEFRRWKPFTGLSVVL